MKVNNTFLLYEVFSQYILYIKAQDIWEIQNNIHSKFYCNTMNIKETLQNHFVGDFTVLTDESKIEITISSK